MYTPDFWRRLTTLYANAVRDRESLTVDYYDGIETEQARRAELRAALDEEAQQEPKTLTETTCDEELQVLREVD